MYIYIRARALSIPGRFALKTVFRRGRLPPFRIPFRDDTCSSERIKTDISPGTSAPVYLLTPSFFPQVNRENRFSFVGVRKTKLNTRRNNADEQAGREVRFFTRVNPGVRKQKTAFVAVRTVSTTSVRNEYNDAAVPE